MRVRPQAETLFATVNNFYLGAYQEAVNEGLDLADLSDAEAIERDFFVHRAYIAMGQSAVSDAAGRWLPALLCLPHESRVRACPYQVADHASCDGLLRHSWF